MPCLPVSMDKQVALQGGEMLCEDSEVKNVTRSLESVLIQA